MCVCRCVSHHHQKQHHEFLLLFLHSSILIRCVVDSVVTLFLMQLDGEEAVTALQSNMECHAPHDEFNLPKK